jgi:hypothetical protein
MGDVNSLLANPTVPDYGATMTSAIGNASALTKLRQTQDDQEVMQAAGQAIADHDLQGAEDIYNRAGKVEAANVINAHRINIEAGHLAAKGDTAGAAKLHLENGYYDQAQKMTTDQLQQTNAVQQKIANAASDPNITPELWNRSIDALKSTFPTQATNIEGFRDFKTGPKVALEVAGKTQEFNDNLIKQRAALMAENKAGYLVNANRSAEQAGPTQDNAPLPPIVTPGTARKDLTTGQVIPSSFTPNAPESVKPNTVQTFTPTGAAIEDASKDKSSAVERQVKQIQEEFEQAHPGEKLPSLVVAKALEKSGGGIPKFAKDKNGDWDYKLDAPEGSLAYTRTNEGKYDLTSASKNAANDSTVGARKQLGQVIEEHSGLLTELSNRPEFDKAMAFLHTPEGAQFWEGKVLPSGTQVPKTAVDLKMSVNSISGEYNNFVSQGHKGVLHTGEADTVSKIGQSLYNAPNAESFRENLYTLGKLAAAFQHVKPLGPKSEYQQSKESTGAPTQSAGGGQAAPAMEGSGGIPQGYSGPTASGKNGEKYILQNNQWVVTK